MNKKKNLICDVDGTLIDRMPIYRDVFCSLAGEKGVSRDVAAAFYYDTVGTPLSRQFKRIFEEQRIAFSENEIEELSKRFFEIAAQTKPLLFPSVLETIKELRRKRISLFLTSGSNTREMTAFFQEIGIVQEFKIILGSDETEKGPAHIIAFAEASGLALSDFCRETAYIGDGPADMRIAKEFGLLGIGITNTVPAEKLREAGATEIVTDFRDVVSFFD